MRASGENGLKLRTQVDCCSTFKVKYTGALAGAAVGGVVGTAVAGGAGGCAWVEAAAGGFVGCGAAVGAEVAAGVHALNNNMLATMVRENNFQNIFFILFLLNSDLPGYST
jgi:outer membrane lipoprotein SlyB